MSGDEKILQGQIGIYRRQGRFDGTDYLETIVVELVDRKSGAHFLDVEVGMAEFMKALTGRGGINCSLLVRPKAVALLGTRAESMRVVVKAPHPFGDKVKRQQAEAAVREHETDGWKARMEDIDNHHCYVEDGIKVVFYRHVEDK